MKLLLATLSLALFAGCTDTNEPPVVAPDQQVFAGIYEGAARQVVAAPFSIDLATCGTARLAVPSTDDEGNQGDQYALTHLSADGTCQVWLGYDEVTPIQTVHTDIYCELPPSGTEQVVLASPDSGGGGCGGPPGAPVLSIASSRCVAIYQ